MYIVLLLLLVHTLPIASSLSTSNILHFVRFTKKLHEDHYSIKLFINLKRNVQSFFINLKRNVQSFLCIQRMGKYSFSFLPNKS